ncbi:MAG: restriction endonuclease subunit M [Thaumarchaeota archaeon]|nr:restriction endonuclease subunit M [Nitrososphaerota archaeon]
MNNSSDKSNQDYSENPKISELIKIGIKDGYLRIKENKIEYIYCKKEYRFSDPEEKIRAATYVSLIRDYQYPPKNIDVEVSPPRRDPKLPADIVVFKDEDHNVPYIVAEIKAKGRKSDIIEAKRECLGNSNLLNSNYLLIVCDTERLAYDVSKQPSLKKLDNFVIADIPKKYDKVPKYKYKRNDSKMDLTRTSFNELSKKFELCHDEIWEGGKRDPAVAFDEISKIMFAKIYDETYAEVDSYYKFQIGTYEEPAEVSKRIINDLYAPAQEREPDVFKSDIELPSQIIFRLVEILQDISLTKTDLDAKGRAFESFLGTLFRGEYGQYFTRREIVEFMVSMMKPDEKDTIIDPSCGSGGFLLYCLKSVRNRIKERHKGDQRTINRIDWDFAHKRIFGIEVNDRISRVAMMDMVIHDDGHTNIETHDALDDFKHFDKRKGIEPGKFSLILTNPPFGALVKDENILNSFELGKGRERQRTEILFIERCLELLKIGGRMGIVLPDGILTNTSLSYVRDFIKKNSKILAVVSLPPTTFIPAGSGVKTSLLFLEKVGEPSQTSYPIFMANVEHVGYDSTGKPDTEDFTEILSKYDEFKKGEL